MNDQAAALMAAAFSLPAVNEMFSSDTMRQGYTDGPES